MPRFDVWLPQPHIAKITARAAQLAQGKSTLLRAIVTERLARRQRDPLPKAPPPTGKIPLILPAEVDSELKAAAAEEGWPTTSELVRAIVEEWAQQLPAEPEITGENTHADNR